MNKSRRHALVLLIVSALGMAALKGQEQTQYNPDALSNFLDGDMYMMQDDYEQAAAAFRRALMFDSTSATIYIRFAEALLNLGRLESAQAAAGKALVLEPSDPTIYELLSRLAAAQNDYDGAIEHLENWAQLDSTNLEPYFRKASLQLRKNDFADAIDTYVYIYDRDNIQQQLLPRAGEIALSISDLGRAFEVYRRLFKASPGNMNVARTYGEICIRTNHYDEAIPVYEMLISSGAAGPSHQLQMAWLYQMNERWVDALAVLKAATESGQRQWDILAMYGHVASRLSDFEALEYASQLMTQVYPDSVAGYTSRAIALSNLDRRESAIQVLEESRSRFPHHVDINYLLANLYFDLESYAEAATRIQVAYDEEPTSWPFRHLLASIWSGMGKYGQSDSLFEALLDESTEDAGVLNNYAYSLVDRDMPTKKQLKLARKLSRKSLKSEPENPAFLDTYGWIMYARGKYKQALKYIARSVDLRADNQVVLEHLAQVYRQLGKPGLAEEFNNRALQLREKSTAQINSNSDEQR